MPDSARFCQILEVKPGFGYFCPVWTLKADGRQPESQYLEFPIWATIITCAALAMTFSGVHNAYASHGMFNDVGKNQYNCIFQLASLESAFDTANGISSLVQQVEGSREQLQVLATSIGTLLRKLDVEYRAGRLSASKTSLALENLTMYVSPAILTRKLADQVADLDIDYLIISTHLCIRKPLPNS
jgi:hypothetical protein